MARKIEIELTSRRDDGSWTWRAAGAREPKGTVAGSVVPEGARPGDVLRAEAEFDVEGIVVVAATALRAGTREESAANRIEVLGSGREGAAGVSVSLAPGRRPRRDEEETRRARRSTGPGRGERRERAVRGTEEGRGAGGPERGERAGRAGGPERGERAGRGPVRGERARRLQTVTTNRNAMLADLRPEQLPVAEQLLRGGVPAVRQAIDEQNARARAEGRAEVAVGPLLAMAEQLLPRVNLAVWKDRAAAVRSAGGDTPLRELRAVVAASSTVQLDEEGRGVAAELRAALDTRVKAMLDTWLGSISNALGGGRVLDALRASAKPPDRSARVPAELAVRLSAAAGEAMTADTKPGEWSELLEAVLNSPVRRTVKPAGLPAEPDEALMASIRRAAGLVPELARLLGLPIPPPPGPRRAAGPPVSRASNVTGHYS